MADEEDDFGEFGGFEAADPNLAGQEPQNVEASPSPWALFPTGTAAPDLIQAQGMVYPHGMEPPFSHDDNSAAAAGTNNNAVPPADAVGFYMENDLLASNAQPTLSHEDVLELSHGSGSSGGSRSQGLCHQGIVPQPPDIQSLDITAQSLRNGPDGDVPVDILPLDRPEVAANHIPPPAEIGEELRNNEQFPDVGQAQAAAAPCRQKTQRVAELAQQLSAVDQEKQRIQQDLDELLARHNELVVEFDATQLQLAEQREKYKTLQSKHEKDLEDIRGAGHEALVVIVEEYKALCRTAVLEQKDVMERHLQDCLKAEREKFEEMLESQRDRLVQSIEEEKSKNVEEMKKMREELQEQHQHELQSFLQKEQEKQKDILSAAIREEHEASQRLLKTATEEERERTKTLLEKEKESSRIFFEGEQEKFSKTLKEAIEQERAKSKEAIAESLKAEQQRSKDVMHEIVVKSQAEMKDYINENRQSDATVRRKQLTSLDLFLEGARQQLADLMKKTSEENG